MRYTNTAIKKDKDGKRSYKPSFVSDIPLSDSDLFIYPRYGDRLDTLAQRYYGDVSLWWVIAKANQIKSGQMIPPKEQQIRIPMNLGGIAESLRSNSY